VSSGERVASEASIEDRGAGIIIAQADRLA
jgi:hypothetical protein